VIKRHCLQQQKTVERKTPQKLKKSSNWIKKSADKELKSGINHVTEHCVCVNTDTVNLARTH
jgi:hypothetical protein